METILSALATIIISIIESSGYLGIAFLMILESAGIPVPSEIIMPFAGVLVTNSRLSFLGVVIAGTIGNLLGSLLAYQIASVGGRKLVKRVGRYFLFPEHDLKTSENWFERFGPATVFFGRLLPIIRTYVSFPAGLARMSLNKFIIYTSLGSLPWSMLLTYIGLKTGENWQVIREKFRGFDYLIGIILIAGLVYWILRHKNSRIKEVN